MRRTRERLVNVLHGLGQKVGLPRSPSVSHIQYNEHYYNTVWNVVRTGPAIPPRGQVVPPPINVGHSPSFVHPPFVSWSNPLSNNPPSYVSFSSIFHLTIRNSFTAPFIYIHLSVDILIHYFIHSFMDPSFLQPFANHPFSHLTATTPTDIQHLTFNNQPNTQTPNPAPTAITIMGPLLTTTNQTPSSNDPYKYQHPEDRNRDR